MSKIHLFMDMCANADGEDFICDVEELEESNLEVAFELVELMSNG